MSDDSSGEVKVSIISVDVISFTHFFHLEMVIFWSDDCAGNWGNSEVIVHFLSYSPLPLPKKSQKLFLACSLQQSPKEKKNTTCCFTEVHIIPAYDFS